jgi:hypothetical protein
MISEITIDGIKSRCGYVLMPFMASLAKLPSEGIGTATPSPRKDRKLSVKIEDGICRVVITMRVPMQFVSRCLKKQNRSGAGSHRSRDHAFPSGENAVFFSAADMLFPG